jgi:hypothetical protein
MATDMYTAMKTLTLIELRERHPDASEEELRRYLTELLLGPELTTWLYRKIAEER